MIIVKGMGLLLLCIGGILVVAWATENLWAVLGASLAAYAAVLYVRVRTGR
jgi:hypothetical protein